MGQLMDKFHGSQWRDKQIRKITDKVYDRFKQQQTGSGDLTFEDIYIAVLLVYNDMNKYLPGPHFDPPSRAEVKATMEEFDINLDGELNHEEFVKFIQQLTTDTCVIGSRKFGRYFMVALKLTAGSLLLFGQFWRALPLKHVRCEDD
ncbi:hypothetical protein QQ045_011723 [Rhodiola kirilowii]